MFGGMCWYDDTHIQLNFFYSCVRSQMLYRIKPGNKFMLKRSSRTTRRKQWPCFRTLSNAISCLAVDKHSYPFHFRLLQISSKQPKVKRNFMLENKCQHSVKCPKLLTTRLFLSFYRYKETMIKTLWAFLHSVTQEQVSNASGMPSIAGWKRHWKMPLAKVCLIKGISLTKSLAFMLSNRLENPLVW